MIVFGIGHQRTQVSAAQALCVGRGGDDLAEGVVAMADDAALGIDFTDQALRRVEAKACGTVPALPLNGLACDAVVTSALPIGTAPGHGPTANTEPT